MSSGYNGVDAYPVTLTIPSDGDAANASSINTPIEGLADRTTNLHLHKVDIGTLAITPQTVTRSAGLYFRDLEANWTLNVAALGDWGTIYQANIGAVRSIFVDLDLPNACVLNTITVQICGAIGGHAGLPAAKPSISLYKFSAAPFNAPGTVASVTDAPASIAAYETIHTLTLGALALTIDAGFRYRVRIVGESGANSVIGLAIASVLCNYTISALDAG